MKRFIEGDARGQATLLPELLDDYVAENNPVRVVDVFVDELDLGKLGFEGVLPAKTGRPSYHPAVLLKLYIYGYLNRIQSSRRLEREAQRNVELMWLTQRLAPDFKTIANFRKDNGKAIHNVCRQFVVLCRQLDLFSDALVAIDGSKFKAVNSSDRNFTQAKLKRRMEEIEANIGRYLAELDTADRQEPATKQARTARLNDKIAAMKSQMAALKEIDAKLEATGDTQISLTDPDARSMMTRGSGIVGYNVQTAVDAKHHLIVEHEVTNIGYEDGMIQEAACWAHARRKFYDLHEARPSGLTTEALHRIGELYTIEAKIRGKPPHERQQARQAEAKPLIDDLERWLRGMLEKLSRKSDTSAAIMYALNLWPALTRYCDDGIIEIDNSAAERALRGVAIGRRNYLFAGADTGGERAAAIYSLIGTAKMNGVDPEA